MSSAIFSQSFAWISGSKSVSPPKRKAAEEIFFPFSRISLRRGTTPALTQWKTSRTRSSVAPTGMDSFFFRGRKEEEEERVSFQSGLIQEKKDPFESFPLFTFELPKQHVIHMSFRVDRTRDLPADLDPFFQGRGEDREIGFRPRVQPRCVRAALQGRLPLRELLGDGRGAREVAGGLADVGQGPLVEGSGGGPEAREQRAEALGGRRLVDHARERRLLRRPGLGGPLPGGQHDHLVPAEEALDALCA